MKAVAMPDHLMNTFMKSPAANWAKVLKEADVPKVGRSIFAFILLLLNLMIPNPTITQIATMKLSEMLVSMPDFEQYDL
jgi:hypothetical protein